MPTVDENVRRWSKYDWTHEGHRWSPGATRAGTDLMWWRSIRPRLYQHLPAGTILEIAPGFGRWTAYLIHETARLLAVDVTERCIEVCRERFAGTAAEFWVNDGRSLPTVADASVDVGFSLDSLVHVEAEPVSGYLDELARILKPGGVAFLHHSNLGAYAGRDGAIPVWVRERFWRAPSVSARVVRHAGRRAGLVCVSQELVNWVGHASDIERHELRGEHVPLTDCFSVFMRPRLPISATPAPTRVYINRHFVDEWRQLVEMAQVYSSPSDFTATPASGGRQPRRVRRSPWRGLRPKAAGWIFARREPLARAVASGRCPDCGAPLGSISGLAHCATCDIALLLS